MAFGDMGKKLSFSSKNETKGVNQIFQQTQSKKNLRKLI